MPQVVCSGPRRILREGLVLVVVGAVLTIGILLLLASSMSKDVGRDEQMYCTGGALVCQGRLPYRDFAYAAQLPYHTLVLAAAYRLTGTSQYLLLGRLVSVACDLVCLILVLALYRAAFPWDPNLGMVFGLAAVLLCLFNPVMMLYALGYAWNHDLVIVLVLAAAWVWVTTDWTGTRVPVRMAFVGVLVAMAAWTRVTTALVLVLFAAAVTWRAVKHRRAHWAVAFVLGTGAASCWPVWVVAQAPRAFALDLVSIPGHYGQWLHEIGMVLAKLPMALGALATPGSFVLIALCLTSWIVAWKAGYRPGVVDLLAWVFVAVAFIPPTMWPQYWGIPIPFFAAGLAGPLAGICRAWVRTRWIVRAVMAAAVVTTVWVGRGLLTPLPLAAQPGFWVPVTYHQTALAVCSQVQGRVLTLAPLLALEGGCEIYPELSCGSITFRVADRLSPEQRSVTRTVGPESLGAVLKAHPPGAVVTGAEVKEFRFLEGPFLDAVGSDWTCKRVHADLTVYYRSKSQAVTPDN